MAKMAAVETRKRLEKCWSEDLDWSLFPDSLRKVCILLSLTKKMSYPHLYRVAFRLARLCASHL